MVRSDSTFDWDDLLTCIEERRVVPIIGKELLVLRDGDREVLLDHYLGECLAERLRVEPEARGGREGLDAVVMAHLRKGGDAGKILRTLVPIMAERKLATPPALAKLAEISDFGLFVTTTFDSLMCQALDEHRPSGLSPEQCRIYAPHKHTSDPDYDLPTDWKARRCPFVYYLFGKLSTIADDCAVSEEDYLEFVSTLQTEERRPQNLFDAFKANHLLFLGCGFENWLERFFIRTVRGERFSPSYGGMQVVADREAGRGGNLTVFLQLYRMQVFCEGDPVQFIGELHRRWRARHPAAAGREPAIEPPRIESAGVFLSYASEDLPAARNLRDALNAAGLDVWFDKATGVLPPGAVWEARIRSGIERCSVFVPLLSGRAQHDTESYFRKEWDIAIERSKGIDEETAPFILPVVIAEDPPDPSAPGIRREFSRYQQPPHFPEGRPTADFVERVKGMVKRQRRKEGGY